MSNPNWNKDSNAGRNSKGGSFKWVGSKDSKW